MKSNEPTATARIAAITTVSEAEDLAAEWYGLAEDSESDDIREVLIAAWVNAADRLDDGATETEAFQDLVTVVNNQFPATI